ncbi:unnamed protein product [Cochlearia groenlandica]
MDEIDMMNIKILIMAGGIVIVVIFGHILAWCCEDMKEVEASARVRETARVRDIARVRDRTVLAPGEQVIIHV